jgi:hypothetical protein
MQFSDIEISQLKKNWSKNAATFNTYWTNFEIQYAAYSWRKGCYRGICEAEDCRIFSGPTGWSATYRPLRRLRSRQCHRWSISNCQGKAKHFDETEMRLNFKALLVLFTSSGSPRFYLVGEIHKSSPRWKTTYGGKARESLQECSEARFLCGLITLRFGDFHYLFN